MAQTQPRLATFDDIARLPDVRRVEIINGVIVEKANPTFEHSDAQLALGAALREPFHRTAGGGRGGWWIVTECDIELEPHELYRPDLVGWRRDRVKERPSGRPVRVVPDWVCEVLSPSNAENDLTKKFRVFQRQRVHHYWVVDPNERLLIVHRWTDQGYLVALTAAHDETVRAEPFEALELRVGMLFGEEQEA